MTICISMLTMPMFFISRFCYANVASQYIFRCETDLKDYDLLTFDTPLLLHAKLDDQTRRQHRYLEDDCQPYDITETKLGTA